MAIPKLQRRRFGRAAAVAVSAALAVSLAGCAPGGGAADGPVTIEYWGWAFGLEEIVDVWNEEHDDIKVEFTRMAGGDMEKVNAAIEAGEAPDLVQMATELLIDYRLKDQVLDITDYVGDTEDDYTAASWANATIEGRVYGLPQGTGPGAMMYRVDIFEQYGIEVPTTWDEYIDAARKLHAANPDIVLANYAPDNSGQWQIEIHQAGASWYEVDGDAWKVSVNGAPSQEVAERWQTMLDEGIITTQPMYTPEYWAALSAGSIASVIHGAWFPAFIAENSPDTAGNWRVAPMPSEDGSIVAGDTGGAVVAVLSETEHPAEAAEFLAWLNGSEETQDLLITKSGLFPSTISGLASPALLEPYEFFGGQVINEVFAEASAAEPATWSQGPNSPVAFQAIADEFSKAVNGEQTYLEALDKAQETTVNDLKARGFSVAE